MKILKIFIPSFVMFFMFMFPLTEVFAAELNLKNFDISYDGDKKISPENLFDSNQETGVTIQYLRSVKLKLNEPQYLTSFAIIKSKSQFNISFYDGEGKRIHALIHTSNEPLVDLTAIKEKRIHSIIIGTVSSSTNTIYELYITGNQPVEHTGDIKDFDIKGGYNTAELKWDSIDLKKHAVEKIKIYRNGELIKSVNPTSTSYIDTGLTPEKEYNYKITWLYTDGFETEGTTKQVKTDIEPNLYLKDIKTVSQMESITLSWEKEEGRLKEYKNILIYRNGELINKLAPSSTNIEDKDLKPNKEYVYTFKVISQTDKETTQDDIKVTTLKEPKPVIEGANFQKVNEDYVITWEQPTSGKVQIFVGGSLYKEVDAKTKTFTIPKKDMKTNSIGNLDIYIKPIAKHGTEGDIVEAPKTNDIPFSVEDLIQTGGSLLYYVGPLVLIGLSFLLYPKIKRLITSANKNEKGEKERQEKRDRRSKEDIKTKQEKIEKNKKLKERQEKEQRKLKKEMQKLEKEVKKVEQLPKERKRVRPSRMTRKTDRSIKIKREPSHINKREIRTSRETREQREPRNRDRRF